jgi:hypothetical protein
MQEIQWFEAVSQSPEIIVFGKFLGISMFLGAFWETFRRFLGKTMAVSLRRKC